MVRPITGMTEDEILWDLPLSRGLAYLHAAMAREGIDTRWSGGPSEPDPIMERARKMMADSKRRKLTGAH